MRVESIEPSLACNQLYTERMALSLTLSVSSPGDVIANDIERRHRCQEPVVHPLEGFQGLVRVPEAHRWPQKALTKPSTPAKPVQLQPEQPSLNERSSTQASYFCWIFNKLVHISCRIGLGTTNDDICSNFKDFRASFHASFHAQKASHASLK